MNETAPSALKGREGEGVLHKEHLLYESSLPAWADRIGSHVLIKGDEVIGVFPSRDEALMAGDSRFGLVPLFVDEVRPEPRVYDVGNVEF